ncbi:MAG: multiheme c-type cytochrome [Bacteroidota bacterium]
MKKLALSILAVFIAVPALVLGQNKYVGVKQCMPCHKTEKLGGTAYVVWEKTPHAKAFDALKTKEADAIATKAGSTKPAAETAECVTCHVTGTNKPEEGVSCEACHGAGSAYKAVHAKKDADDKAKAGAGMVMGDALKKACTDCHNEKSPNFKSFDYAKMWEKIAHSGKKI